MVSPKLAVVVTSIAALESGVAGVAARSPAVAAEAAAALSSLFRLTLAFFWREVDGGKGLSNKFITCFSRILNLRIFKFCFLECSKVYFSVRINSYIRHFFVNRKLLLCKGELISKAIYGLPTSPKKRTDKFVFFAFFTLHGKQNKFVRSVFWRIYCSPIWFLVLSDLRKTKK